MARDHARVNIAIWASTEFRELSPAAQHLYFVLVTSSTLNYAGVADWRPRRLSALAGGWAESDVTAAARELSEARVLIIDGDTEEALVRTWIKHDGLIDQPRMAVSVANAYAGVSSLTIRGVIVHELTKLKASKPELKGWVKPKLLEVLDEPSVDPADTPVYAQTEVALGPNESSVSPSPATADLGQTELRLGPNQTSATPAPAPATSPSSCSILPATSSQTDRNTYPPAFEEFWSAYPKKADKRAALKAWEQAIKRARPEDITSGAKRYRDDPNRDEAYTKNASTWLNADAWGNDPLPDRTRPAERSRTANYDQQRHQANNELYQRMTQGGDLWSNDSSTKQLGQ